MPRNSYFVRFDQTAGLLDDGLYQRTAHQYYIQKPRMVRHMTLQINFSQMSW